MERIARNEVEKTVLGRTAECSAIYHQPKRPKKRENWVRIMKYFVECCGCDYRNGKTKGVNMGLGVENSVKSGRESDLSVLRK